MKERIRTPERDEFIRRTWPSSMDTQMIVQQVNALPGLHPVTYHQIRKYAYDLNVSRPFTRGYGKKPPQSKTSENLARAVAADFRDEKLPFDSSWPVPQTVRLIHLWNKGHSGTRIGERMGCSKSSIIGKAHRLIESGLLKPRASPIVQTGQPSRKRKPRPEISSSTLPKLPSIAPPPLIVADKQPVEKREAPAAIAKAAPGHISPFDNVTFRPVRKEAPPIAYVPPVRKCAFPLWKNSARPTHKYCDAPADRRSYCKAHADLCFTRLFAIRDIAA